MQFTSRLILLIIMLLSTASHQVIAIEPGKVTSGVNFQTPDWFKDSFLEIASDVEEASEVGLTERALADYLKIRGTPTILLLSSNSKVVLRLSGYRSVEALQQAFNFVQQKAYMKTTWSSPDTVN